MSDFYSAMLSLEGLLCVVVGGGKVAARKVRRLLETGARVRLIAPACVPELRQLASDGRIELAERPYTAGDLSGAALAFAATDARPVNAAVAADARALGIPVNVADDRQLSTLLVPAKVERQGLTISISTAGHSPAFARRLREEIEQLLSAERLELFDLYAELRANLAQAGQSVDASAWVSAGDRALELLKVGRKEDARRMLRDQVQAGAGRQG